MPQLPSKSHNFPKHFEPTDAPLEAVAALLQSPILPLDGRLGVWCMCGVQFVNLILNLIGKIVHGLFQLGMVNIYQISTHWTPFRLYLTVQFFLFICSMYITSAKGVKIREHGICLIMTISRAVSSLEEGLKNIRDLLFSFFTFFILKIL